MGIRGELFSTKFTCDGRTYFFNVKQNRTGDVFLSIVESKPSEGETFDRRSVVVFGEHMDGFLKSFQAALKFMDKTGNRVAPDESLYSRDEDDDEKSPYQRRPQGERSRGGSFGDRSSEERSYGSYGDRSRSERPYSDRSHSGSSERRGQGRAEYYHRDSDGRKPTNRTERPDRAERPDRTERPDRGERSDRTDHYQGDRYREGGHSSDQRRAGKPVVHVGSREKRPDGRKSDSATRPDSGAAKPIKKIVVRKAKKNDEPKGDA